MQGLVWMTMTKHFVLMLATLMIAAAFAGCAEPEEADDPFTPGVDDDDQDRVHVDGMLYACVEESDAAMAPDQGDMDGANDTMDDQQQVGEQPNDNPQQTEDQQQQQPDQMCMTYELTDETDEEAPQFTSENGRVQIHGEWYECASSEFQPEGEQQDGVGQDQQAEDQQQAGQDQQAETPVCQTWHHEDSFPDDEFAADDETETAQG